MPLDQAARSVFLTEFVQAFFLSMRYFFKSEGDHQLSVREEPAVAALPRRACAAALSERRGTLHRLQAVRGGLPGAGDHHRGRPAPERRHPPHHPLRHRHGQMHLLRAVPGSLPGGRHRRGAELRIRHRNARGALLRQGTPARERRPLGTRDRQEHRARRAVPLRRRAHDPASDLFLALRRRVHRLGDHGDRVEESRSLGAVPDPRLRQCRGPVRADGRRVPGDDLDRRLCRRGRGAVPVRGDDARRRFHRAAPGLSQLSADRRRDRLSSCWSSSSPSFAPG